MEFLSQLFVSLLTVFPRRVIVKATEQGVLWKWGAKPELKQPGVYIYWPLVSDLLVFTTARQPADLPSQFGTTADGISVSFALTAFYRTLDISKALGRFQFNHEDALCDIVQSQALREIRGYALGELDFDAIEGQILGQVQKAMAVYTVEVDSVRFKDFAPTKVLRVVGDSKYISED